MFSYTSASPRRRAAERLDPPPMLKPASLLAAHIRPLLTSYSRRASEVNMVDFRRVYRTPALPPSRYRPPAPTCARLPCVDDKHCKCTVRFVSGLQLQDFRVSGSQTASFNLPIPTSHIKARPQSGHWLTEWHPAQRQASPYPVLEAFELLSFPAKHG
jgi:hypothetical protein